MFNAHVVYELLVGHKKNQDFPEGSPLPVIKSISPKNEKKIGQGRGRVSATPFLNPPMLNNSEVFTGILSIEVDLTLGSLTIKFNKWTL